MDGETAVGVLEGGRRGQGGVIEPLQCSRLEQLNLGL